MSLRWLQVSDCEQRGCFHLQYIMSLRWLQVSDCEQWGCFVNDASESCRAPRDGLEQGILLCQEWNRKLLEPPVSKSYM
ncbi:hypothetical protein EAO17_29060 [Klebsiella pneumoniae]|uniref:Uncharacterized protein n=1 Tax=Klebsiella pneumoniae TaxID=573 RepID=A0ABD7J608_KLEPN|nr:hypothetical protein EAO17_29060 [Klebsiella pneumoniae]